MLTKQQTPEKAMANARGALEPDHRTPRQGEAGQGGRGELQGVPEEGRLRAERSHQLARVARTTHDRNRRRSERPAGAQGAPAGRRRSLREVGCRSPDRSGAARDAVHRAVPGGPRDLPRVHRLDADERRRRVARVPATGTGSTATGRRCTTGPSGPPCGGPFSSRSSRSRSEFADRLRPRDALPQGVSRARRPDRRSSCCR